MKKELNKAIEDEILKFLTFNPKAHIYQICDHIVEKTEFISEDLEVQRKFHFLTSEERESSARTAVLKLHKSGEIKSIKHETVVFRKVEKKIKSKRTWLGHLVITENQKFTAWFLYEIADKNAGALIGTHLYGI